MSRRVNLRGRVVETEDIDGVEGIKPAVATDTTGAKVDMAGYVYVEEVIDGVTGRIPVVSSDGGGVGGTMDHAALTNLDFAASGHVGFASLVDILNMATLGPDGKLVYEQIPDILLGATRFIGNWDAANNSPALSNGMGEHGTYYIVSNAGYQMGKDWLIGDWALNVNGTWIQITTTAIIRSVNGMTGDVDLQPIHLGLENVDNTSDLSKPISNAMQNALNLKADQTALDGHVNSTGAHVSTVDRTNWDGKASSADLTAHTSDTNIHTNLTEKAYWNGKQDAISPQFSGFNRPFEDITSNIEMNGAVSAGLFNSIARGDHRHPTDITRASEAALNSHIQATQTALDAKADQTALDGHTGDTVAHLNATERADLVFVDGSGKIPVEKLPSQVVGALRFMGTWDAANNTPALTNGDINDNATFYAVQVAGTQFGIDWKVGDYAINVYGDWRVIIGREDMVQSVNGRTGLVVLTANDFGLGTIVADLDNHIADMLMHVSASDRTNWNSKVSPSDLAGYLETVGGDMTGDINMDGASLVFTDPTNKLSGIYGNYSGTTVNKASLIWAMNKTHPLLPDGSDFGPDFMGFAHIYNQPSSPFFKYTAMAGYSQAVWAIGGEPRASVGDAGFWTDGGYKIKGKDNTSVILAGGGTELLSNLSGGGVNFETNTVNILMNGTVSVGTLTTVARADHRHPTDNTKEPVISPKNTAFNVNFETNAVNILMNGVASVGTTISTARADHRHPTDTTREPVIGTKGTAFNVNFETNTANILMNGAASVGTLATAARGNHRHPSDTTKADVDHDHNVVLNSTKIGYNALANRTTGINNTAVGDSALQATSSGGNNTAVGHLCAKGITTGNSNTAVGDSALLATTSGSQNTAVGASALTSNTGTANTAVGYFSLPINTAGYNNTSIGAESMNKTTSGAFNTSAGWQAMFSTTNGSSNVGIGASAMFSNTTGSNNTVVGENASRNTITGGNNVIIGKSAFYNGTSGDNTIVGATAMYSSSGAGNTAIGYGAAYSNSTGDANVIVGRYAMYSNTTGRANVAVGALASYSCTNAVQSTFLGVDAGRYAVSSSTPTGQTQLVIIGGSAKQGAVNTTNEVVIGYNAVGGGSNTVTLGNTSITQLRCHVTTITAISDRRLKENIQDANIEMCYQSVKSLRTSRFKYKNFTGKRIDNMVTGFMADDFEQVFPKSVTKRDEVFPLLDRYGNEQYETVTRREPMGVDDHGNQIFEDVETEELVTQVIKDVKSITPTELVPTLWGAVQYLGSKIEEMEETIKTLQFEIGRVRR